jgi:iron complex outermembrane receptor protein
MFHSTPRFRSRIGLAAILLASTASPLLAQTPAEAKDGEDSIVVTGRRISQSDQAIGVGEITNVVAVTREALLSAPSGVSGLKMLETLPGFNVQTDGALGLYEFGNSVQTRAFNLDQIGFVIDGIPLGRSDPFGGSPVFRYVDNENLREVRASVGAGDVSLPSYASLGPIVQYLSIAPQDELGLFVSQTLGEDDLRRTFIRVSTGLVGPVKAYVSRTKLDSDLWRGAGSIDREHWEARADIDLGGSSWASLKFVSNDFFDYDSPTLTRADYLSATPDAGGKTGRYRGYIGVLPTYAPTAPGIPFSDNRYTYYYKTAINVRKDKLFGGTIHAGISDAIFAESTIYYEDKDGYGVSPDAYANSLSRFTPQRAAGLAVTAPRGSQYGLSEVGGHRIGALSKLQAEFGVQTFQIGVWMEDDKYHRTQLRKNLTGGSPDGDVIENEIVYFRRNYRTHRSTTQLFAKDDIALFDDKLNVTLGVKSLSVDYGLRGYRDFNDYYRVVGGVGVPGYGPQRVQTNYHDHFLPLAGVTYKIDGRTQIFASYAENLSLPKGLDDIFSTTFNSSSRIVPKPAAERSKNYELGVRTNQSEFYAALAGYYTKFANRIQSIATLAPGTTTVTETFFTNVGRVKAWGVEFTGSYKPSFLGGLAYVSGNVTYNNAKFRDNIPGGAAIAGKYLPDSAKWIVNGGVTVEPASWLVANISGKYTSKRYANFVNTFSVPAYTVWSAYVDIGDGFSLGPIKNAKARINVDNLFDKDVLSFISPQVTADGLFRPLSPRTIQFTVTAEF